MTPRLPCSEYLLDYSTEGEYRLPRYAGSAWRGAFGHALKKTVCVVRGLPCAECMLYRSCAYPYIFETPPPPDSDKMRRYNSAPHPFAIATDPPQDPSGYRLRLVLFGKAHGLLPYLIHGFDKAGQWGLGQHKQPFRLERVRQRPLADPRSEDWHTVYAPGQPLTALAPRCPELPPVPERVGIVLESPLRLRRESSLVTPTRFRFGDLFSSLLRRISMLTHFHTDTPLETDFAGLTRAAAQVDIIDRDLRWWDWTRYSSRQQTEMQMGGLLGSFILDGAQLEPFWPYLWLGQWTHAGKAATMGLGRYRIAADIAPNRPAACDHPEPTP